MAGKRIYELTEKSSLASGDFIAVDSSGQQDAQKVNASKITLPLANISQSTDEYSSATAYKVGGMVIHDNVLYVCNTACAAAPWSTNQGYFTATTIAAELNALNTSLTKIGIIGTISAVNTNYLIPNGLKLSDYKYITVILVSTNNLIYDFQEAPMSFFIQDYYHLHPNNYSGSIGYIRYKDDTHLNIPEIPASPFSFYVYLHN